MPTIKVKYSFTNKLIGYAVGGFGYAWFTNKNLKGGTALNGWRNETLPNSGSIASKLGLGLQYNFTKHWTAFVEGAYRYQDTGGGVRTSIDTWGWSFGGGVKYYF